MSTPWDARTYDVSSAPQQAWAKDVLSRLDGIAPDATILDVGCGTGRVTESLLALVPAGRVLAIYADAGMLLACEASTNWACFKTGGAATGTQVFPRLPMGRYHLVVDADKPGSEGGVVLKLSALPSP